MITGKIIFDVGGECEYYEINECGEYTLELETFKTDDEKKEHLYPKYSIETKKNENGDSVWTISIKNVYTNVKELSYTDDKKIIEHSEEIYEVSRIVLKSALGFISEVSQIIMETYSDKYSEDKYPYYISGVNYQINHESEKIEISFTVLKDVPVRLSLK